MQVSIDHTEIIPIPLRPASIPFKAIQYSEILDYFGIEYQAKGHHLLVGKIKNVQGWILHLSVVISQVQSLLELVVPLLVKENLPFQIVMDKIACDDLLSGNYGIPQIGKIVSIYPENDSIALDLARKLIGLTSFFKGPSIPTDICLGSIVYTRYGSFSPILQFNSAGVEEKYIYNLKGELIRDSYAIPFQKPVDIAWPFDELATISFPKPKQILNGVYKPLTILKIDPRGNVFKGIYLKNLFNVKKCVIKQGYKNMNSDAEGRDIQDRLNWQYTLFNKLSPTIPLPTIFDIFQEEGTYLVMEYINGGSFYDKLKEINPDSKSWHQLSIQIKCLILDYVIKITSIIDQLHKKGYIHRDIVPVNFLITKTSKIFLIDMELAYSLNDKYPTPPFSLGTPGFMSPEQQNVITPTVKEDIYGLGALILEALSGLTPVKFNTKNPTFLLKNILFFIGNKEVATMITNCLNQEPNHRPNILEIQNILGAYRTELQSKKKAEKNKQVLETVNILSLKETIAAALEGLVKPPILYINDLWYSKTTNIENAGAPRSLQYSMAYGVSEGIGGIIYLLARVYKIGIKTEFCKKHFTKCWGLYEKVHFNTIQPHSTGLYTGSAGVALVLGISIHSGLLQDESANREKINKCLEIYNEDIDLANGIIGQGISILQCRSYLSKGFYLSRLDKIIDKLLNTQKEDGSWIPHQNGKKLNAEKIISFGYGISGIIWFLLEYISIYPNEEIQKSIQKSLKWLLKKHDPEKKHRGVITTLIKAYETLHEDKYRKIAENALSKIPSCTVETDFTQQSGLAGMGELYLEAWQVFKNEEWKYRADWIANLYIHSFFKNDTDSGCWIIDEHNPPTADFMTGNSGIIHFLVRCLNPSKMGYRLLK